MYRNPNYCTRLGPLHEYLITGLDYISTLHMFNYNHYNYPEIAQYTGHKTCMKKILLMCELCQINSP